MKRMLIGLLAGAVTFGGSVQAQEFAQAPTDLPHLTGADLFVDLDKYVGKQVVITDAEVFGANNVGAIMHAGPVTFKITSDGIDRESFRYFLKNCDKTPNANCICWRHRPVRCSPIGPNWRA